MQITRGWYEHVTFRACTQLRGGMTVLIYRKMMSMPLGGVSESAAMSLMGSDVETLAEMAAWGIAETWSNFIQLIIAAYLLGREVGPVSIAPVIVAISQHKTLFSSSMYAFKHC
jgi:ATP-binding cassette subfamily C (CFTR/MRP) protein 1